MGSSWRTRLTLAGGFLAAAVLPLVAYASFNAVRFDDFAIGRGGGAGIPTYRAYVVDGIVERANGQATRELAAAIERDLLRLEPYRSLGLTADEVLALGETWPFDDLIAMSDRVWGWDDDYAQLQAVGREAVRAHPGAYARGVLDTLRELGFERYSGPPGAGWVGVLREPGDPLPPPPSQGDPGAVASIALVNNWALTASEPRFRIVGGLNPRTGVLWSPYEKRDLDWGDADEDRRYEELRAIVIDRLGQLSRGARHRGEPVLRAMMSLTPALAWWVLAAALLWLVRRPRGLAVPLVLAAASAAILLLTALGFPPDRTTRRRSCPWRAALRRGARTDSRRKKRGRPVSSCRVRLASLETLFCDAGWRPWIFVKATADDGSVGWAEVTDSHGSPRGLAGIVEDLAPVVVGRDPRAVEAIYWDLTGTRDRAPGRSSRRRSPGSRTRSST